MSTVENNANLVAQVVTTHDCDTYETIAYHSGLTVQTVSLTLWWLRKPGNAKYLGWTIPHVRRGRSMGVRRYCVVGLQGQVLDPDDRALVREGCRGTLSHTATMAEGEYHALQVAARMAPEQRTKRRLNWMARKLEFIAAEAREMLEVEFDHATP